MNGSLTCIVHYAAIGAGSLAIIIVLIYVIHRSRRRRSTRSTQNSASQSHLNTPKSTGSSGAAGGFFGYPRSPHDVNTSHDGHQHPNDNPISNSNVSSPSSPQSGPGRLKKSNSAPKRLAPPPIQHHNHGQGHERMDEETEMVMVTYEEGLKKLGLERIPEHRVHHQQLHHQQQHGIYPDSPIMNHEGEITIGIDTPTPILSSGSSRPTPTTAQLLSPSKSGKRYQGESQYRADVSPVGRTKIGKLHDDGVGRFPTDSELGTNFVPSYYPQTTAAVRGRPESPPSAYSGTR